MLGDKGHGIIFEPQKLLLSQNLQEEGDTTTRRGCVLGKQCPLMATKSTLEDKVTLCMGATTQQLLMTTFAKMEIGRTHGFVF